MAVGDLNDDGNDDVAVGARTSWAGGLSHAGEAFTFLWSIFPCDNPAGFVYPQYTPNKIYLAFEVHGPLDWLGLMVCDGQEWKPTLITQSQTYPYTPTMTLFQDELWVATTAHPTNNPEPIMIRIYNGTAWTGPTPAPAYTAGAINPALASFRYEGPLRVYNWLFVFWQTPEDNIYGTAYETIDGWLEEPFAVTTDPAIDMEPTAAVYDQLYVAWVSNDTILYKSFNGMTWSPTTDLDLTHHPSGPCLVVHEDLLYMAYEAEGQVHIQNFNGDTWTSGPEIKGSQPSPYDPTICSYNGSSGLCLIYVSNGRLYSQTSDGDGGSTPEVVPEFSNAIVSLILISVLTLVVLIIKKRARV